jgi:lipopolysaccharide assembly outer membrane protein LptD (OstA)
MALLSLAVGARADEEATNAVTSGGPVPTIQAEKMSFDESSKLGNAEGHVVIHDKEVTLVADHVRYNKGSGEFWADGNVRINQAAQEWAAPSAYYNFTTHTLKTDDARGFVDPIYLHVWNLEQVASNHFVFGRSSVTTCDEEHSDYHLESVHGEIWTKDRMVLHNATVRFGNTPVAWFPIVMWSLKGDMTPIALTMGDNSRWGYFLLSSVTWKVNRDVQATVHADERLDRGFGTGVDVQYRFGSADQGLLTGYYLNDARTNRVDTELDIDHNKSRAERQHKQ